jgi:hypothetical protein
MMDQRAAALRNTFTVLFLAFFLISTLGGLFWANLVYVQRSPTSLDFLPLWKGLNNLLIEGLPPYGEFTTYEIQKLAYGRAAGPAEMPLRVGLPFSNLLIFLPLGAFGDVELAQAAWMVILELGLLLLAFFSLRLAQWSARWHIFLPLALFVFSWAPSVESLLLGRANILLLVFILGAMLALQASFDELAGFLLALSFFEIESGGVLLLFLVASITLSGRWRAWAGLLMTLTLLLFAAWIIDPNWPLGFARAVLINWNANPAPSTFSIFTAWFPGLGPRLASGLTFIIFLFLMVESQQALGRNRLHWFWAACLAAAVTPLTGMPVENGGMVFQLPALILAASVFSQRWAVIGPWVALLALLMAWLGGWIFQALAVESGFLWLSLFSIFLLYWVRWWVVRPARLWADQVSNINRRPW